MATTGLWIGVFWVSAAVIAYACALYPVGLRLLRPLHRPWMRATSNGPVSIVIAARNEAGTIAERVREILRRMEQAGVRGEVIVASDGSTDGTVDAVRESGLPCARVVELSDHCGKAAAINLGCSEAKHDIIVLADARQTWERETLPKLLENFADPEVGAVSGELVLRRSGGALAAVGLYWRLEKWMRRQESLLHSCIGVTGAICAVRRRLFSPIPVGTILDDVYWPLRVVLSGYRVVHDHRARSFDRLPPRSRDEFLRKVRTLSGNFDLICSLPSALIPGRNPVFLQFVSHKLVRLAVPWAMLGLFVASGALAHDFFRVAFVTQGVGYTLALVGIASRAASRRPLVSLAAGFLLLNSACMLAFFVWLCGASERLWRPIRYESGT